MRMRGLALVVAAGCSFHAGRAAPVDDAPSDPVVDAVPDAIPDAQTDCIRSVGVRHDFSCAVRTDGSVWCWGNNTNGKLGDGTIVGRPTPARVATIGGIASVTLSSHSAFAVADSGSLYAWGDNSHGQ